MTQNGSTVVANGKSSPLKRDELKIVIVGDGGCGKTSLLMVYAKGDFPEVMLKDTHPHVLLPVMFLTQCGHHVRSDHSIKKKVSFFKNLTYQY